MEEENDIQAMQHGREAAMHSLMLIKLQFSISFKNNSSCWVAEFFCLHSVTQKQMAVYHMAYATSKK